MDLEDGKHGGFGAPTPVGAWSPPCAVCIMYALYKVLKPAHMLLTCSPAKTDGLGVGDFMMGLEKLFLGYGPWLGGTWLKFRDLGSMLQKAGHAGGSLQV